MTGSPFMRVNVLEDTGWQQAIYGLSLSYGTDFETAAKTAERLCGKDGGHNKFLEAMYVWLKVQGPRYWWQEADTYRLSTKQSESTMHTLMKDLCTVSPGEIMDFIDKHFERTISPDLVQEMAALAKSGADLWTIKALLPEGFLQTRVWCMSYKTLRNIILQRRNHRLPHWRRFIEQVLLQVQHPELLPTLEGEKP